MRPQELNILILGETGVGKSTWINGFYNYLTYSSLKEAEENDLCSKIPTKFIVTDDNFEEIIVSTGEDTNEVQHPGQSTTQQSKEHSFKLPEGTMIRLIDTPGIGDTGGIDQDKANFENILNTLSNHKELHGICILMKPNNARLSVVFRYCIKELLTYLHRDASKNIMFCFTNSRGTFYRQGDTLPGLKELLKSNPDVDIPISKQTVYCYDSESYRFLAAIKNKSHPIKFPNEEQENFVKSWEMSCKETNRMMEHIKSLTPHPIPNTMNLNFARQIAQKLTRPMAEITRNIQNNISVLQDDIKEIEQTKANIKDLEKRKLVKKIRYHTQEVDVMVEDQNIVKDLESTCLVADIKQKMIDRKNQLIEELNKELKIIQEASVKFSLFLKRNAITPYNDGMVEYLHHLIHEEKSKIASGGDRKVLDSLQYQLEGYNHQVNNYFSSTNHQLTYKVIPFSYQH